MTTSLKIALALTAMFAPPLLDLGDGKIGVIYLPEISGAVQLQGVAGAPLLLVGDEDDNIHVLEDPLKALRANKPSSFKALAEPSGLKGEVNDMEGVAWDPDTRTAYVLTSHSVNKENLHKPKRQTISAIKFKENGEPEAKTKPTKQMQALLKSDDHKGTNYGLAYDRLTSGVGGPHGALNIEGLTFDSQKKDLLVGFRSPTEGDSAAYVLSISNPQAIGGAAPLIAKVEALNLGVGRGIRAMTYDPTNQVVWLIAGASHDSATLAVDKWSLYRWKRGRQPVELTQAALRDAVPGYDKTLWNAEALAILGKGEEAVLAVISDAGDINGAEGPSPFVLFPLKALQGG